MKEYNFTEATPLIDFLDSHRDSIIGSCLKNFYVHYWPNYGSYIMSDEPVVLQLDDRFVVVYYFLPSDIEIIVGTREEIEQHRDAASMLQMKDRLVDYYDQEFGRGAKKDEIENCRITEIRIDHFSHAFECNPCTGEMRPEGGDYFSTIRLCLDSGTTLCFCGADSISDGYIEVWCE